MPNYRRYYIPNSIVFITCVTTNRTPYLKTDDDIGLFMDTLKHVQQIYPFHLLAYVILPDHFHWLLNPKENKNNFSVILHSLKRNYTLNYKRQQHIT